MANMKVLWSTSRIAGALKWSITKVSCGEVKSAL